MLVTCIFVVGSDAACFCEKRTEMLTASNAQKYDHKVESEATTPGSTVLSQYINTFKGAADSNEASDGPSVSNVMKIT